MLIISVLLKIIFIVSILKLLSKTKDQSLFLFLLFGNFNICSFTMILFWVNNCNWSLGQTHFFMWGHLLVPTTFAKVAFSTETAFASPHKGQLTGHLGSSPGSPPFYRLLCLPSCQVLFLFHYFTVGLFVSSYIPSGDSLTSIELF